MGPWAALSEDRSQQVVPNNLGFLRRKCNLETAVTGNSWGQKRQVLHQNKVLCWEETLVLETGHCCCLEKPDKKQNKGK